MKESHGFRVGQYIIYVSRDKEKGRYEIGRIKRFTPDGEDAWVYYHSGDTAAITRLEDMHPLQNAYSIHETGLGGEEGKAYFAETLD